MKKLLLLSLGIFSLSLLQVTAKPSFGTIPDPFTGNWSGTYSTGKKTMPLHATVVEFKNGYEVTFRSNPDPRQDALSIFSGKKEGDTLVLRPGPSLEKSEYVEIQRGADLRKVVLQEGTVTGDLLSGKFTERNSGTFSLKRVPFKPSPSLGKKAPNGATVLFDGSNLDAWEVRRAPNDSIQWKLTTDGVLEVVSIVNGKKNKQDLTTREQFGDYTLHLEFKLPHKPSATGQGRCNSGIFHLGIYETQILDSYGLYGYYNECGGIYKIREPDSNACYPGGLWQTYDVQFTTAKVDANGKKTANARMTVRLNGILIHDDAEVTKPNSGDKEATTGPIILQDHGNPVQFRNIWVMRN